MKKWLALWIFLLPVMAKASPIAIDLSNYLVGITTNFSGEDVLLFGAVSEKVAKESDIIVVVEGPLRDITIRKKNRVAGIWMNTEEEQVQNIPGFFATITTRPLKDLLTDEVARQTGLAENGLPANLYTKTLPDWSHGLIRTMRQKGLYLEQSHGIIFLEDKLMRLLLPFPVNVPVGDFRIHVYLLQNGQVISDKHINMAIKKQGIGAKITDFAKEYAFFYGLFAVLFAFAAGFGSNLLFGRRR